jgi:SAM-dependent methyltransferase
MGIIDKHNFFSKMCSISHIELELGCGNRKLNRQAVGIDILDYDDVDIIGDIYEVLSLFHPQSVDAVYSYHFAEHVSDLPMLLTELARIVKLGGCVEFVVPHFSNPYFYSDPTHRNFFGLYTFCYFGVTCPFTRHVPTYGYKTNFSIIKVDLIFKSSRPFFFRHGIKRIIGSVFNSCTYLKELYEENFCYLFPCYEIRYLLRREA